jgi:sterol desaturase/sphingolipid hydroxylase (fatty acid hydroxylase superfamily)
MEFSSPILDIAVRFLLAMLPVFLLGLVCIGLELKFPRERYSLRARAFGFALLVLTPGLVFLLAYPLGALWRSIGVPPAIGFTAWPPVAQFALQLILVDFLRYAEHRVEHRILWPVHAVHHSVTELHAANSYAHPLMAVTEVLVVAIPLSMVDFSISPAWVFTALAFQNLIIHSPTRFHLGRWGSVIVDNRYHRIHHSRESRHYERNFGFLFTLWDRLFGTYHRPAPDEWPDVGIDGLEPPASLRDYLLHPLRHFRFDRKQQDAGSTGQG